MQQPVVVITGASDGIGRGLAEAFAARGAAVVLAARQREKLEEVRAECERRGARAIAVPTDVADPEACRRLIERAAGELGSIDLLVNNAGISMQGRFDEVTSLDIFAKLMAVNYLGAVYCTHAALPHLRRTKGMVVAISSLQGKFAFPGSTGYCASKHALQGFFDALRMELAGSIGVLTVSPGPVATAIHNRRLGTDGEVIDRDGRTAGMSIERCVALIVRAIDRRDRDLVMTASGKLAVMLRPLFPRLVDRRVARSVEQFYERLAETPPRSP